jgi:hypothetical protein
MGDVQQTFFDFENECPGEIMDCENLRNQYKEELQKLEQSGSCSGCLKRSLQQKYIMFINSMKQ